MTTTEAEKTEATPVEETKAEAKSTGKDYTKIVSKEPTNLHVHYWKWLQEKTGFSADATDAEAVKIVQMAVSLYQPYQASDENKQRRVDEAEAREKAVEENKAKKAAEKAEKEREKAAKAEAEKSEREAAGESDEGAKRQPAPKKGAKTAVNKAASGEAPF